jgi:hypothetical protein
MCYWETNCQIWTNVIDGGGEGGGEGGGVCFFVKSSPNNHWECVMCGGGVWEEMEHPGTLGSRRKHENEGNGTHTHTHTYKHKTWGWGNKFNKMRKSDTHYREYYYI